MGLEYAYASEMPTTEPAQPIPSSLRRKERKDEMHAAGRIRRIRPGTIAGIFGMLLVAALYSTHFLLLNSGGDGLGAPWFLLLVSPGILAAHLSCRRGASSEAESEGVRAGLFMAHFAAVLQVVTLIVGVLNVDWARYAGQVGHEIADGVHQAAIPATVVAAGAVIAVTYIGCIGMNWLGALLYRRITNC